LSEKFYKFSGTGNDFILFDNRDGHISAENAELFKRLCKRRLGIGADGVVLFEKSKTCDFRMRYFNADDGKEAEMCGNGGRVISYFAHQALSTESRGEYSFQTYNSVYQSKVDGDYVELKMPELYDEGRYDLSKYSDYQFGLYINTGAPHAVFPVIDLKKFPVETKGAAIRKDSLFECGTNVNFFEILNEKKVRLRTFERGVEAETLACGTGAVAVAYALFKKYSMRREVLFEVLGGQLKVLFDNDFKNVWLCGKVDFIYSGEVEF
jgi:diaminopimelate epimerase